ncbi:NAD(P)-binding protein [Suillus variegatus]|nr:NAD(P)-binding protein [Suillus variegatus]
MADSATPAQADQPHVALITGAAHGIGRAIALRLAEDGLDIAIADLKSQRTTLDGVADEIRAKGKRCLVLECDISQEDEVQRMVQATEQEFNSLDVVRALWAVKLSNCLTNTTLVDFDEVFNTNVRGTFLCLRAAAQTMIKQGRGGRIISASSVAGKKGWAFNSFYSASKSAIRSFTQALASELGSHGITVNAYAPGPVETHLRFLIASIALQYETNVALRRIGTPEDIANAVSFLASKDSAYITGQTITSQDPHTMSDPASSTTLTIQPRVALITGAAQGIGRSIALRLAEDGLDIAIADLASQRTKLDGVAEEVRAKGRRCIVLECNVSQEEEVQRMVQATEKEFDGLDVMVANAGRLLVKTIVDSTLTDFDSIFDTNVRGVFLCLRAAAQVMIKRGRGGKIISASSVSGKKGVALNGIYCASKAAVRSFTQALVKSGHYGITVNAYAPGPIDTPLRSRPLIDRNALQFQGNSALKHVGMPEDVAGLVSFLASKDSAFITGQTITIDGGGWMD